MHVVLGLIVAIVLIFGALSYAEARGIDKKRAERWIFGILAFLAVAFVLFRAGLHWLAVAAGAVFAIYTKVMRVLQVARFAKSIGDRAKGSKVPPAAPPAKMTRKEALEVLGLPAGASRDEVMGEYRRLMKRVHPDQGGSEYLAARLNEAKDVLLG